MNFFLSFCLFFCSHWTKQEIFQSFHEESKGIWATQQEGRLSARWLILHFQLLAPLKFHFILTWLWLNDQLNKTYTLTTLVLQQNILSLWHYFLHHLKETSCKILWLKFILGLMSFGLVSILFAIVSDYGNEYNYDKWM